MHPGIRPSPFLDFALTARVLRRSTRNLVDRVGDDGTWTRAVVLSRGPALLRGRQRGATITFDASPAGAGDERAIEALVTRLFALDLDLAPFWRRARREPGFADLARRCIGLRPQRFPTLFEALAKGICCQQLSLASGLTRLGHLAERFGPWTSGDVGAARPLGRILGRVIEPEAAPRFAARFAPHRGMLYFCMLGHVLALHSTHF